VVAVDGRARGEGAGQRLLGQRGRAVEGELVGRAQGGAVNVKCIIINTKGALSGSYLFRRWGRGLGGLGDLGEVESEASTGRGIVGCDCGSHLFRKFARLLGLEFGLANWRSFALRRRGC
jgi:hypothetical protein